MRYKWEKKTVLNNWLRYRSFPVLRNDFSVKDEFFFQTKVTKLHTKLKIGWDTEDLLSLGMIYL